MFLVKNKMEAFLFLEGLESNKDFGNNFRFILVYFIYTNNALKYLTWIKKHPVNGEWSFLNIAWVDKSKFLFFSITVTDIKKTMFKKD